MSAREATMEVAGSAVRRSHLLLIGIVLVLTLAAGVLVGRALQPRSETTGGVAPIVLTHLGDGHDRARVYRAINDLERV